MNSSLAHMPAALPAVLYSAPTQSLLALESFTVDESFNPDEPQVEVARPLTDTHFAGLVDRRLDREIIGGLDPVVAVRVVRRNSDYLDKLHLLHSAEQLTDAVEGDDEGRRQLEGMIRRVGSLPDDAFAREEVGCSVEELKSNFCAVWANDELVARFKGTMIRECLLEIERMRASLREEYDAAITLADGSAMDLSHSKMVTLDLMDLAGGASVGLITFNDPARMNAMTEGMAYVFRSVVDRVRGIRPDVLIVMGAGRAFSAGGDMGMIRRKQQRSVEINRAAMFAFYSAYLSLLDLEIPVIAAINGAAIGAGLCFACACDRRIAVDIDKKVLGFSFAKLGLTPGMGGTIFPRRLVGEGTAGEMLRRGYNITPKEAKEIGMVDDVVPAERFMSAAIEMADRIHSSPKAVERILAERVGRGERVELLGMEAMAQGASFLTERHLRMYGKFMAEFEERKGRRRQPS